MGKIRYLAPQVYKKLGLRVRSLRQERGWTLEECEERGITNWRHLQAVESGKNVNVRTLVNIANLFNVKLSDLFIDL